MCGLSLFGVSCPCVKLVSFDLVPLVDTIDVCPPSMSVVLPFPGYHHPCLPVPLTSNLLFTLHPHQFWVSHHHWSRSPSLFIFVSGDVLGQNSLVVLDSLLVDH